MSKKYKQYNYIPQTKQQLYDENEALREQLKHLERERDNLLNILATFDLETAEQAVGVDIDLIKLKERGVGCLND